MGQVRKYDGYKECDANVEWLALLLLLLIRKVRGSIPNPKAGCPEVLCFTSVHPSNYWNSTLDQARLVSFHILYNSSFGPKIILPIELCS
jgi:hypothetical protein